MTITDFHIIKKDCESIEGIDNQISFLNSQRSEAVNLLIQKLEKAFLEFSKKEQNIIFKRNKDADYFLLTLNIDSKLLNTYQLFKDFNRIILKLPFNKLLDEDYFNSKVVQDEVLKEIGFKINFKLKNSYNYIQSQINDAYSLVSQIDDHLKVKKTFKVYVERGDEFNFDNLFEFDYYDRKLNGVFIVEFSRNIKKYSTKIVYLKTAQEVTGIGYDDVANEIIKLDNIIRYANPDFNSVTDSVEIKSISNNENKNLKIQWRGNDTDLFYLLNELEKNGFLSDIDKKNFIKLIEKYFIDCKGKQFKNKNITQAMNNLFINKENKSRNSSKIDKMIDELKTEKPNL